MIKNRFLEEIEKMKKLRHQAVEEACVIVQADAIEFAPRITGNLRRSITHKVESDDKVTEGAVGTNVIYALRAERSKPYLSRSVDQNLATIERKMAEVLKG